MSASKPTLITLLIGCACLQATADELILDGSSSKLSGRILTIEPEGIIQLESPLAIKPLKLKAESLVKAAFSPTQETTPDAPIRIKLINDDIIVATAVLGMNDGVMNVETLGAGTIPISTSTIQSIQFGVRPNQVLYPTKNEAINWLDTNEERRNWKFNQDTLVVDGSGTVSNKFELPEDFIISFKLGWNKKNPPNFRMSIASPENATRDDPGFYRFTYNPSSIQLERQTKNQTSMLAQLRRPQKDPNKTSVDVEIHIKRSQRQLELFIDGEPEGRYADPVGKLPQGDLITMICYGNDGSNQQISSFRILAIDNLSSRHLAEGRGDPNADVIISNDDDRIPGRLESITSNGDTNLITFINETIQTEPMQYPQSEVSTVFFAKRSPEVADPFAKVNFNIMMPYQGKLQISGCTMQGDTLSVSHPLLGKLNIGRPFIETITKSGKPGS